MIVENDALIAMFLSELLEEMGGVVCAIAETQVDAVADAAKYRPDLMIVDATLDEGSGIAAVNEILRGGHVPHFFVTGDRARVLAVLPDAIVVQKPFSPRDLEGAISRACQVEGIAH
jgi:DNA-binding response OmpR family regulator